MARKNMSQICQEWGLDKSTLRDWRREGAPFTKSGRQCLADPEELRAWAKANGKYMRHGRRHGDFTSVGKISKEIQREVDKEFRGAPEDLKEALAKAELRKRLADAEKKELDLATQRGDLVERSAVERGLLERIAVVRGGMINLGHKLKARLSLTDEEKQMVDDEVEQLIAMYRQDFEEKEL